MSHDTVETKPAVENLCFYVYFFLLFYFKITSSALSGEKFCYFLIIVVIDFPFYVP